jgi:hypothetical protein
MAPERAALAQQLPGGELPSARASHCEASVLQVLVRQLQLPG